MRLVFQMVLFIQGSGGPNCKNRHSSLVLNNFHRAVGIIAMQTGPIQTTLQNAMDETEEIIYNVVEELLRKTKTHPRDVSTSFFTQYQHVHILPLTLTEHCSHGIGHKGT